MVAKAGLNVTFGQRIRLALKPITSTALTLVTLTAFITPAFAQTGTCDPTYWEALKAKAWTEAQREITQNQNLIYKADSILEYSCFDRFLESLATVIRVQGALFSETNHWPASSAPTNMVNALDNLVARSVTQYVSQNFGHTFLGGRDTGNYTPDATGGGQALYNCNVMAQVWTAAKCINFVDEATLDDFFYLDAYNGFDPRGLPPGNACTADGRFAAQLSLARNDGDQYPREPFNMYATFFATDSCGATPIRTGVTVDRSGIAAYQEHICVNPGCAFDRAGACTASPP
jgi:hypothetical protein